MELFELPLIALTRLRWYFGTRARFRTAGPQTVTVPVVASQSSIAVRVENTSPAGDYTVLVDFVHITDGNPKVNPRRPLLTFAPSVHVSSLRVTLSSSRSHSLLLLILSSPRSHSSDNSCQAAFWYDDDSDDDTAAP